MEKYKTPDQNLVDESIKDYTEWYIIPPKVPDSSLPMEEDHSDFFENDWNGQPFGD